MRRGISTGTRFRLEARYLDVETAKRAGRTGFAEMVAFLRKNPKCRVLIVEKTDRLYRNLKDWVTLDEIDLEIHLVKENVVISPDSRSSEKFMHGIKVLMAKNYIDNLSEESRKGMLQKARKFRYAHPDLTRGFSWRSDGSERGRVKVHCGKCGEFLFSLEARRRGSCAGCRSVETPRRVGETPTGPGWSEDLDRFRDRFSDRFSEMPDD